MGLFSRTNDIKQLRSQIQRLKSEIQDWRVRYSHALYCGNCHQLRTCPICKEAMKTNGPVPVQRVSTRATEERVRGETWNKAMEIIRANIVISTDGGENYVRSDIFELLNEAIREEGVNDQYPQR